MKLKLKKKTQKKGQNTIEMNEMCEVEIIP
jgi:hypothetical protein